MNKVPDSPAEGQQETPAQAVAAPPRQEAYFFGQTPLDLTYRADVSNGAARLYAFLAFQGMTMAGFVPVATPTLIAEFGGSRAQFFRCLKELYDFGYAEPVGRQGSNARGIQVLRPDQTDLTDYAKMTMRRTVRESERNLARLKNETCHVSKMRPAPNHIRENSSEPEARTAGVHSNARGKNRKRTREDGGLPALPSVNLPPPVSASLGEDWRGKISARLSEGNAARETAKKTGASRRLAAQVAKPRRGGGAVARFEELDSTPREHWGMRHFYAYVYRKMMAEDKTLASQPVGLTMTPKAMAQLKALVTHFVDVRWPPDEVLSRSLAVALRFVDFVYADSEELGKALKLVGKVTPGVLYGFRGPLIEAFNGTRALGRSEMAAGDSTTGPRGADIEKLGIRSTSKKI